MELFSITVCSIYLSLFLIFVSINNTHTQQKVINSNIVYQFFFLLRDRQMFFVTNTRNTALLLDWRTGNLARISVIYNISRSKCEIRVLSSSAYIHIYVVKSHNSRCSWSCRVFRCVSPLLLRTSSSLCVDEQIRRQLYNAGQQRDMNS